MTLYSSSCWQWRSSLLMALFALVMATGWSGRLAAEQAASVVVAPARPAAVGDSLLLSGSLTAVRDASLSPRVDGLVAEVLVDAGDRVEAGEVLLRQDPALARLALEQARAATAEATAARDEAQRLVAEAERLQAQQSIPETETRARRARLSLAAAAREAAVAREREAAEQLRRHDLPAPFTGVISARTTEAGEWVSRGDAVLELVALHPVRLDIQVPQERFGQVDAATPVEVLPDALPGSSFPGRVTAVVPVSDPQARAFLVRVEVDDSAGRLLPGTSATAQFRLGTDQVAGVLIPRDALLRQPDGGQGVFVVHDGRAERRVVTVLRESGGGVVVGEGVAVGDWLVVRGNEMLRDGQAVSPVEQ